MIILLILILILVILSFLLGYKYHSDIIKKSDKKIKKNFNDKYNIRL